MGMFAILPLMSHSAISTPLIALFNTGPLRQYEFTIIMFHKSVILVGSRPTKSGLRYSSTARATSVGRCVNVAQPRPYKPCWSVSTFTTTSVMPSGAVRIDLILVIFIRARIVLTFEKCQHNLTLLLNGIRLYRREKT